MVASVNYDVTATLKETASAMKIYTDYTKNTGYSETSSQSFIIGKLASSHNPVVLAVYFTNIYSNHAVALYGHDDRYYNGRYFVIDPEGDGYNDYYDSSSIGGYIEFDGVAYFLVGEW